MGRGREEEAEPSFSLGAGIEVVRREGAKEGGREGRREGGHSYRHRRCRPGRSCPEGRRQHDSPPCPRPSVVERKVCWKSGGGKEGET